MWYDQLSDEQIQWLKDNRTPWNLLLYHNEKELFENIPLEHIEVYNTFYDYTSTNKLWKKAEIEYKRRVNGIYRLNPEWQKPDNKVITMWYDSLSDEQIKWLQENTTPWYLLTGETKGLFNNIPTIVTQTIVEVNGQYVWVPLTDFNKSTSGIYRLDPNWKKPSKPKTVDTVPYMHRHDPYIRIPLPNCDAFKFERLHGLRNRADWLWIKWEWYDKQLMYNRMYVWYEFPGNIVRGDIPTTGQNLMEYNEDPPMPVLVRWKKKED